MIRLRGDKVCLRALEPGDVELLYRWENDPAVWEVSETLAPYSRDVLRRFIENQQYDIYRTRQLRLVICRREDETPVGLADLFDFDPHNLRAGVGIIIYSEGDRRRGYASEALVLLENYARESLGLRQLHCSVHADNPASIALFRSRGFEESGVRRDWSRSAEGWRDEVFFQKIFR